MSEEICGHPPCERTVYAKGLCSLHYRRMRKGQPLDAPHRFKAPPQECSVEGCPTMAFAKGFCRFHYQRWRTGVPLDAGKYDTSREPRGPRQSKKGMVLTCTVEGCEEKARARGLCGFHYSRWQHGVSLEKRRKAEANQVCKVEWCDKKARNRGYCAMHWSRHIRGLDMDHRGRLHTTAREPLGARRIDKDGYASVKVQDIPGQHNTNWQREHRHVMEQHIGRPLRDLETVHHVNGDRSDNRLENLELWSSYQPSGQRVRDKVEWAREILETYGDLVDRSLI